MTLDDIKKLKMEDINNISDSYNWYFCKSEIVKFGLEAPKRIFTDDEISEIFKEAGCDDPDEVPFVIIANKYYESDRIDILMKDAPTYAARMVEILLTDQCRENYNNKFLDVESYYKFFSELMNYEKGRERFIEFYNNNKLIIYMNGIQFMMNKVVFMKKLCNDGPVSEYFEAFTSKIPYPISDDFDLISFIEDFLFNYYNKYYNRRNKEICILHHDVKYISVDEALSNFPNDIASDVKAIAESHADTLFKSIHEYQTFDSMF